MSPGRRAPGLITQLQVPLQALQFNSIFWLRMMSPSAWVSD